MDHAKSGVPLAASALHQATDVDISAASRRHRTAPPPADKSSVAQHHQLRLLRFDGGFLGDRRLLLRPVGEPVIVGLLTRGSALRANAVERSAVTRARSRFASVWARVALTWARVASACRSDDRARAP